MSCKVVKYQLIWLFRRIKRKLTGKPIGSEIYADREIISLQKANKLMAQLIAEERTFAAGRLGSVELEAVWRSERSQKPAVQKRILKMMRNNAGFFPENAKLLKRFTDVMKNAVTKMDLLAVWYNQMEDYVLESYGKNALLTDLTALEPWYVDDPWTSGLKGKRVLIIHPFAETIQKQYQRRKYLFDKEDILPEFEALYTVKAVQTIAGATDDRFKNWFEAFEWMYEEAMKTDFEVAIIGCGAYGFPLAAKIKESGRCAIHMGGATQLLFGIKGRRWDQHPIIGKLYNDYWVRPADNERPAGAASVEEGCYW